MKKKYVVDIYIYSDKGHSRVFFRVRGGRTRKSLGACIYASAGARRLTRPV